MGVTVSVADFYFQHRKGMPMNEPTRTPRDVTAPRKLLAKIADRFQVDADKMLETLKATAFKTKKKDRDGVEHDVEISNEQMMQLLIVADQYNLNPFTREIYAFPDKAGIVPVVGVDGWARIMNAHPAFDGIEFEQDDEKCTAIIYRNDRSHPIKVTEYLAECRQKTKAWDTHPKRLMRHKSMIQCGRIAFGFVGIYDPDEADNIRRGNVIEATRDDAVADLNTELGLLEDIKHAGATID